MQKINPINEKGFRSNKHHQHLSENTGKKHLESHLIQIIGYMKIASNWQEFMLYMKKSGLLKNDKEDLFNENDEI